MKYFINKSQKLLLLILLISSITTGLNAQLFERLGNPQVTISLTHPPGIGMKVNKVAFGPASGTCADQVVDELISDFVSNGIEVVDRENLNTILAEHSFSLSGSVDKTKAASLGKILGPSILIFVKVLRCATDQNKLYEKETRQDTRTKQYYTVYRYISRTRAFFKLSVQSVDLATGRIFSAQTFEYSPEQSNKSYEGYPEFPATFDVQEKAFKWAAWDVHKMYLAWNENRLVYFFDDKDFNLKQAYQALSDGNTDRAFELSKQNLTECRKDEKAKDKITSHAHYNLGLCYMLRNEYDSALKYLNEAENIKSSSIISETIASCQRAKSLNQSMQQVEEKATIETAKAQEAVTKNVEADAASTLTNKSVTDMVKLKLPEAVVIQKIKNSKCRFDTGAEALSELTKAGVGEKIIMAMIEKQ